MRYEIRYDELSEVYVVQLSEDTDVCLGAQSHDEAVEEVEQMIQDGSINDYLMIGG